MRRGWAVGRLEKVLQSLSFAFIIGEGKRIWLPVFYWLGSTRKSAKGCGNSLPIQL